LINDPIGSGKKLAAIVAAIVYRPEWPLLIVCPGVSLRTWRSEFLKWIPKLNFKSKLQIIEEPDE
jgi:SNF2 family DNA or RNA helicase